MLTAYLIFLAAISAQRLMELRISDRNTRWALEQGGVESGRGHFIVMKLLHTSFLIACAAEVFFLERPFRASIGIPMLAVTASAQAIRLWTLRSLGQRWNARIVTVPGLPPVSRGPYRWVRHPNYLAVVLEGIAIPMVHGAWITALVFSLANGLLLRVRVRSEEAALNESSDYAAQMSQRGAMLPNLRTLRLAGARVPDDDCTPSTQPSSLESS